MAYKEPLNELTLGSASYAEDLSFHALIDLARVIADKEIDDARIIGGHMVTLHAQRWGLGDTLYRATLDADLGVPPFVAQSERIVDALEERGYERYTGNRFRREVLELRNQVEENLAVIRRAYPCVHESTEGERACRRQADDNRGSWTGHCSTEGPSLSHRKPVPPHRRGLSDSVEPS